MMIDNPFIPPPLRALRGSEVYGPGSKTGLSKSEIYRMIASGTFPAGFMVGRNSRAWFENEVDHWLMERAKKYPAKGMPAQLARGRKPKNATQPSSEVA